MMHSKERNPSHPHRESRIGLLMPALRTLSNLCRGDSLQTGMVISAGGLPAIVSALKGKVVPSQIQEALFALACVAGGTDAQIVALIDAGKGCAIIACAGQKIKN